MTVQYTGRLLVAEMNWLRRIRGRSRREKIRKEITRRELGVSPSYRNDNRKDTKEKTQLVWTH